MARRRGRKPTDLHAKVREILRHSQPLPPEAAYPLQNYENAVNTNWRLLDYFERRVSRAAYLPAVYAGHLEHLHRLVLANLIEAFERFLKELAGVCVDQLAPYVIDDRFAEFRIDGSQLAGHFEAGSVGKALCESDTWLNNESISRKFRTILRDLAGKPWEWLFPGEQHEPVAERTRARTLAILWQMRHNLTHNVGTLTKSDSHRFQLLARQPVPPARQLAPTREDLRHAKRFLWECSQNANGRIGQRLAELLTALHADNPTLFLPQDKAQEMAQLFGLPLTVAGLTGVP
jgi:hypothetical protein